MDHAQIKMEFNSHFYCPEYSWISFNDDIFVCHVCVRVHCKCTHLTATQQHHLNFLLPLARPFPPPPPELSQLIQEFNPRG